MKYKHNIIHFIVRKDHLNYMKVYLLYILLYVYIYIIDTEIFGYRVDSDPEEREYYISCPFCKKIQLDNGICTSIKCKRCQKVFDIPDQANDILSDNDDDIIVDSNKRNKKKKHKNKHHLCSYHNNNNTINDNNNNANRVVSSFASWFINDGIQYNYHHKTPKELSSVVLIVNKDTLLGHFYIENPRTQIEDISYETIMKNILLPYFKIKSRIIEKGTCLHIGELEFKVTGTFPNNTGIVTSKTFIRLNKYYTANHLIKRALLITTKKHDPFNEHELIKDILSADVQQLQINKGDITKINNNEYYIRNSDPECGRLTEHSEIHIENKDIGWINKIKIGVIQNTAIPEFNNINDKKGYENYIIHEYFNPYFLSGNKKYIERGDNIQIEDLEFFILNCTPEYGYISHDTVATFKIGITKQRCLDKIKKSDNQLAMGLLSFGNNSQHRSASPLRRIGFNDRMFLELIDHTHHRRNLNFDNFESIYEESYNQQKNEDEIRNLPTFIVDDSYLDKIQRNKEECMKKCVICMEEFVIKDELKTLPCFHIYHKNCINEWLRNNMNCVICKTEIGNGNNNGNSSSNGNGMVGSTYQSGLYQMIIGDDDEEEELSMPFPSGD